MGRLVGLFVFVSTMVLSLSVSAQETVKEAETGVEFKVIDAKGRTLLGTGVREKFGFDIYAVAVYANPDEVKQQMAGSNKPVHALIFGSMSRQIVIHFVRNAPGSRIKQNFAETLKIRMTKRQYEVTCKEDYERLLKAVGSGVSKGDRISMDFDGKTFRVFSTDGTKMFETANTDFIRATFKSFLDAKTNMPTLPAGVRTFFANKS